MEKNIVPALVVNKLKALNLYSTQGELANLISDFDGEPMYQSWVSMALSGKNKKTLSRIVAYLIQAHGAVITDFLPQEELQTEIRLLKEAVQRLEERVEKLEGRK
jgi:ubiquinone biosynthesis protein UbiJ